MHGHRSRLASARSREIGQGPNDTRPRIGRIGLEKMRAVLAAMSGKPGRTATSNQ